MKVPARTLKEMAITKIGQYSAKCRARIVQFLEPRKTEQPTQMTVIGTASVQREGVKPFLTTLKHLKSTRGKIDFHHFHVLCLSVANKFVSRNDIFGGVLR